MSYVDRTRPVMTVYTLVVPGNTRSFSGSKTTLIRQAEFNSSGVVSSHSRLLSNDCTRTSFRSRSHDLCRQKDVQMSLTSLHHFLVTSSRANSSLYSTMSTKYAAQYCLVLPAILNLTSKLKTVKSVNHSRDARNC